MRSVLWRKRLPVLLPVFPLLPLRLSLLVACVPSLPLLRCPSCSWLHLLLLGRPSALMSLSWTTCSDCSLSANDANLVALILPRGSSSAFTLAGAMGSKGSKLILASRVAQASSGGRSQGCPYRQAGRDGEGESMPPWGLLRIFLGGRSGSSNRGSRPRGVQTAGRLSLSGRAIAGPLASCCAMRYCSSTDVVCWSPALSGQLVASVPPVTSPTSPSLPSGLTQWSFRRDQRTDIFTSRVNHWGQFLGICAQLLAGEACALVHVQSRAGTRVPES